MPRHSYRERDYTFMNRTGENSLYTVGRVETA
jgi:hypothetical protein